MREAQKTQKQLLPAMGVSSLHAPGYWQCCLQLMLHYTYMALLLLLQYSSLLVMCMCQHVVRNMLHAAADELENLLKMLHGT